MAEPERTIILVGCGNMGRAMLQGWLTQEVLAHDAVHVVEPNNELRQQASAMGVATYSASDALPDDLAPTLVVLAVKPQIMSDVLPAYERFATAGSTFLSIAAGVSTATFEAVLGANTPVIRTMPNTPAAISKGMIVIYNNPHVGEEQSAFVELLMAASGEVTQINDEALMDVVTAVSGSGPAYIFHFIEALRDAGIAAGLPEETAKLLAEQTIYGAACYAKESDLEPGILRQQVTSPNGTTAAALKVLMNDDALTKLVSEAVDAAAKRSRELAE